MVDDFYGNLHNRQVRVFCLSTGRCGSTTFTESFRHAVNYSSAHESRARVLGAKRLEYPDWHVESDNRLAWFLGELDERYGDEPVYVHLVREPSEVVRSFEYRHHSPGTIMRGFGNGILMTGRDRKPDEWRPIAEMYVQTVNANIRLFLRDKSKVVLMRLDDPEPAVRTIWEMAEMQGDLEAAINIWGMHFNSDPRSRS